ncbi:transglutaminase domain-containing protein [Candidatus Ulvibacter alkanivorans]|uniref:transglutaminase domain-containing protein n=1 Tax=Candidatus Ulvibacter alkanivorans TaxID=2267620 RepID=UPI000DF2AFCD|nr:DUF3857 domain-containing protein [Candidatus Ulvibacter alkanivorans]
MKIAIQPSKVILVLTALFMAQYSFSQDYRFGKVSKEEVQQKVHPTDSSANAAILYREMITEFDYNQTEGFYITTEVFERVKIYNKEGFDWATKNVNLYQGSGGAKEEISNLKGYTYYLEDGKVKDQRLKNDGIFEEEMSKFYEQTRFTMPNLSEGCVIEYRYMIKSPYVSNIDAYRFQERIPIEKVSLKFTAPEYLNYKTHQKGWIPFSIATDGNERRMSFRTTRQPRRGEAIPVSETAEVTYRQNIYKVDIEDVPALKQEAFAGNIDNYASSLKFELAYTDYPGSTITTYSTTWDAVSKSIYDSQGFGAELDRSNYFDKDIDALLAGVTNEDEKMFRIFDYVKKKMNWNGFFGYYADEGTKDAYKSGAGNIADINLMLVAMLRYAGLNANPILVSSKSNGIPLFPTRNGFNYVIAGVEKNNTVILLDATNKKGNINILEPEILNWQGRMVRPNGSSTWVSLYPSVHATESAMINVDLHDDLSANGTFKSRYTGHYALSFRNKFTDVNKEETQKLLEKDKAEVEISAIEFENLKNDYEPLKLTYDFESFDAVEEVGGKLYFSPMMFLAIQENPFKLEQRQYPIDFSFPLKDRYLISITIPEGYQVESLPEDIAFGLGQDAGEFRYVISNTGNKIQLSVEFAINQPFLSAEFYPNLKKFYQLLIEKETEKVVLTKA